MNDDVGKILTAAMVLLSRIVVERPDVMRTMVMRSAKRVERVCMSNAVAWADAASVAAKVYDLSRV